MYFKNQQNDAKSNIRASDRYWSRNTSGSPSEHSPLPRDPRHSSLSPSECYLGLLKEIWTT